MRDYSYALISVPALTLSSMAIGAQKDEIVWELTRSKSVGPATESTLVTNANANELHTHTKE